METESTKRARFRNGILGAACIPLIAALCLFYTCLQDPLFDRPYSSVLLDRNGDLLGATIAGDEQWRFPPGDAVPEKFAKALITFEDKRFRSHPGVDPLAVLRALWLNLKEGRVVSGASTLTMQVIRLSRAGRPRSPVEKVIEAVLALRLEMSASKDDILALFAAHAPFGGNVVGLEAAAWRTFSRSPDRLSWAETALLAVLPNSPALIHPGRNRTLLLHKRNGLLDRLAQRGLMDELTLKLSKAEPLPKSPRPLPRLAPHLLARLRCRPGGGSAGESFSTTLDKGLQSQAVRVLERHHRRLAESRIRNAAALILRTDTHEVLAYVGNVGAFDTGKDGNQVDCVTARRSTGSILKPLLYAALIEAGELLPKELVPDVPSHWGGFAPQNFNREYRGAVPADQALSRSLNVPAAHMLSRYGVDRFQDFLKRLGMTTLFRSSRDYGLSLILGGAEGSLWEITGIYAGLGKLMLTQFGSADAPGLPFRKPRLFEDPPEEPGPSPSLSPVSAGASWLTLEAMTRLTRPGIESSLQDIGSSPRIAWKTGTSYGFRDAWAVGVTPCFTIGVWAGNADGEGRPELVGIRAAAPILFDLAGLLDTGPWFEPPEDGLVEIEVCARSGLRRGPHCPEWRKCLAPPAGLKTGPCTYCRTIHLDPETLLRADSACRPVSGLVQARWFVLPPRMAWFYRRFHADYEPLPPFTPGCGESAGTERSTFSLLYPNRNSLIYVPVELSGLPGRAVFQAAHTRPEARIFWHLDEEYLGVTREIHQMAAAPGPGPHTLTLVDDAGEILTVPFAVITKTAARHP